MWRGIRLYALMSAIVVSLGWLSWELSPRRPRINEHTFEQIEKGMTEFQVQSILGAPPGWYAAPGTTPFTGSGWNASAFSAIGGVDEYDGRVLKGWISNEGCILLTFDSEGKVWRNHFDDVISPDGRLSRDHETIWEWVRRRF